MLGCFRQQRTGNKGDDGMKYVHMTLCAAIVTFSCMASGTAHTREPGQIVTQAQIKADKPCAPGCDCVSGADGKGVYGQMQRHVEALMARDKAIVQQIVKKPDNVMGATCLDRSLSATAKLGEIFSDKPSSAKNGVTGSGDPQLSNVGGLAKALNSQDVQSVRKFLDKVQNMGDTKVGETLAIVRTAGVTDIGNPASVMQALRQSGAVSTEADAQKMQANILELSSIGVTNVDALENGLNQARTSGVQQSLQDVNYAISKGMTTYNQVANGIEAAEQVMDLFSGKKTGGMNMAVFGRSAYPMMGLDRTLGIVINEATTSKMDRHARNFAPSDVSSGSLSSALGATSLGFMNTYANGIQQEINAITNGPMRDIQRANDALNTIMRTMNALMPLLGSTPPVGISAVATSINTNLGLVNTSVNNVMGVAMKNIASAFGKIFKKANRNATAQAPCNRLNQLWSGTGVPTGFRSVVGSGIERGVPYFTMNTLLKGKVKGAGADFMQGVLNNAGNGNSVLAASLRDLQGPLSGPGKQPTWTAPPIFTRYMSPKDVIQAMKGNTGP